MPEPLPAIGSQPAEAIFARGPASIVVIPNVLEFNTVYNRGAVFGMGKGLRWVFIGATCFAMIFLLRLFGKSLDNQWVLHSLLGLSLGGAIGNLYDRATIGVVRDFIHITATIGDVPVWPAIFNVADMALVVGIGGLMLGWTFGWIHVHGLQDDKKAIPTARPAGSTSCNCGCGTTGGDGCSPSVNSNEPH
jgi:signal peptidase II